MTKVSAYSFLCLVQLCVLWNALSLAADQQSSDNAIARVTNARNQGNDIWLQVVKDNTSESGWAVDALRNVPPSFTEQNFWVHMWATEKNRPLFRHFFLPADRLCPFVSKKSRWTKYPFEHFMPTQIMKMIFPGRSGSCKFTKGKRAITAKAPVNADRRDPKNEELGFPYTFPFDFMVNIVRVGDSDPLYDYSMQVNFTVDLIDDGSGGQGNGANETNGNSLKDKDVPINVPARVIGVKNGMDNDFFSAVENSSSPTGWAVKVQRRLVRGRIDYDLLFDLYVIDPTNDKALRPIFGGFLCDVIVYNSKYNGYPGNNFLPRQIVDFIFPGHQGSCDFEATTQSIRQNGTVDLNPYDNPNVKLPASTHYDLIANVRSKKNRNESDVYFFQVNFTIGDLQPTINAKTQDECMGTKWNYKIIHQACKTYEFIKSGVSEIGQRIVKSI